MMNILNTDLNKRKVTYPSNRILVFTDMSTKKTVKRYNTSRQYNY